MHQQHSNNPTTGYTQKLALAAGSLSALYLFPTPGQAVIVHQDGTPLSVSMTDPLGTFVDWDVDGAFGRDFVLARYGFGGIYLDSNAYVTGGGHVPLNGQGMVRTTHAHNNVVQNLPLSFSIGPTLAAGYQFSPPAQIYRSILSSGGGIGAAPGFAAGDNFIGFRFDSNGNTLFGWARINLVTGVGGSVTIAEWAYEDSGAPIHLADTATQQVPEPPVHALALLGLGAAGVTAWRRRKARLAA